MIGGDEDLVRRELAGAVKIDRIGRLVGGQRDDPFDAGLQAGLHHVLGADDIGADALEGVVFGGRDLLQRRRMNHIVDAAKRHDEPIVVAHVADEIAQPPLGVERSEVVLHLGLFEFVAGKNHKATNLAFQQQGS